MRAAVTLGKGLHPVASLLGAFAPLAGVSQQFTLEPSFLALFLLIICCQQVVGVEDAPPATS